MDGMWQVEQIQGMDVYARTTLQNLCQNLPYIENLPFIDESVLWFGIKNFIGQWIPVRYNSVQIIYFILQGTMEMLVSGAICGVLYATFAGQPLTIVGATGPLMVFETIVYHLCRWVETVVMTKLSLFDPPIFVLLLSFHLPFPPFLLYLS